MANDFSVIFFNTIVNIRSELGLPGVYKCGSVTISFSGTLLTTFLDALDSGSSAILLMLDLFAAFDTIYHDILLSRLCNVYSITGDALDWFRSYLTSRIQRVVIEDTVSVDQELGFGVPQGSVLGPKIYCMYTKPVSEIIQRHGLSHHSHADDTQLYMTMDHSNHNWRDGLARIQLCVSKIKEWMNQNMLKLNDDNTELIVFTSN